MFFLTWRTNNKALPAGQYTGRKKEEMVKYIDFQTGEHTPEEHHQAVKRLLAEGYKFTGNTFGNPYFCNFNDKTKEDVCILSGIIDDSAYFRM